MHAHQPEETRGETRAPIREVNLQTPHKLGTKVAAPHPAASRRMRDKLGQLCGRPVKIEKKTFLRRLPHSGSPSIPLRLVVLMIRYCSAPASRSAVISSRRGGRKVDGSAAGLTHPTWQPIRAQSGWLLANPLQGKGMKDSTHALAR